MLEYPLNKIITLDSSWFSIVFEFDRINNGGVFIPNEEYSSLSIASSEDYFFRYYKNDKQLVVSSNTNVSESYCALKMSYQNWVCLGCKKLCKFSDSKCFCKTYSIAWKPINPSITGIEFSNDLDFNYHFNQESSLNIVHE